MPEKKEIGGRDLTKFWLYIGVIALCIAALLYMLISAKPRIEPAVKNNHGPSSSIVRPTPGPASAKPAC